MQKTRRPRKQHRHKRNRPVITVQPVQDTPPSLPQAPASSGPAAAQPSCATPAAETRSLPAAPAVQARSTPEAPEAPEAPKAAAPTPPVKLDAQRTWQAQHEAVVGLTHRNASPPMPCQDAAFSRSLPRPLLIVADGAGSAALSEVGSQAVVSGLARLLHTLDRQVAGLLDEQSDTPDPALEQQARNFALLLVKHAKGILDDLAEQQRRPARDFRCTLLLIVAGQQRALWLKIGDGALVFERRSRLADGHLQAELGCLGALGKGEFANITQFIGDRLSPADVQSGLLELQDISGLAAMSDGAAEKLIAQDGSRVARQLEHWLTALRQGRLPRRDLTRSFYSDAFCSGSTGDDCSIALLASDLPQTQDDASPGIAIA